MIVQLDTEVADRDLTSLITVLTDTPDATYPMWCQGLVYLGDGAKDLDGTGGDFSLVLTVGGQTAEPSPQTVTFSTAVRASIMTVAFPVPANTEVILRVLSPNGADTDVGVTAFLYQVDAVDVVAISGDQTAANNCELMFDGTGYAGGTIKLGVDTVAISGDTTAADNCEAMYDGTGYVGGTIKLGVDTVKISGDATAADNCELTFDGTGYAGGTIKTEVDLVSVDGSATLDTVTLTVLFTELLAAASGKITKAGNVYSFKKRDNTTEAFPATYDPGTNTRLHS